MDNPRPFTVYRNRRGWPRWYQPLVEAWWVLTRRHSLHSVWQAGYDEGHMSEYRRLIHNKAYIAEAAGYERRARALPSPPSQEQSR